MYVYYKYDSNGYFIETGLTENLNSLPNNATFKEPSFDNNYWTKWNGKSWVYELKPNSIEYYINNNISYDLNDTSPINLEKISLLVDFVNKNKEYIYKEIDDHISVHRASEEQEENDPELEAIEQQEQELAKQLAELKDSIVVAIATKDDEWLEELRAEYARLMGE